jgi:hypothetical protein
MPTATDATPHYDKSGTKAQLETPLLEESEQEENDAAIGVHIPVLARLYRIFAKIYAKVRPPLPNAGNRAESWRWAGVRCDDRLELGRCHPAEPYRSRARLFRQFELTDM